MPENPGLFVRVMVRMGERHGFLCQKVKWHRNDGGMVYARKCNIGKTPGGQAVARKCANPLNCHNNINLKYLSPPSPLPLYYPHRPVTRTSVATVVNGDRGQ